MFVFLLSAISPDVAVSILMAALIVIFSKLRWNTFGNLGSLTLQDFASEIITSRSVDEFGEIVRGQILAKMSIFVKGFDGHCYAVTTEQNDTIEGVKSTVMATFGIPAHVRISLRFGGKFLESDKFISDYGIQSNSLLYLSLPICGGCGGCSDDPGLGRLVPVSFILCRNQ